MSRRWLLVFAALCAGGVGLAAWVWYRPIDVSEQFGRAIVALGFYPITPPNLLRAPGTIYLVSADGRTTKLLCEVDPNRLRTVLRESASQQMVSDQLRSLRFGLSAEIVQNRSAVERQLLERVSYAFTDVHVLEVSLENLADIATELQQRPGCASEIDRFLRAGHYVCQGQGVLLASAEYSVSSDDRGGGTTTVSTKALEDTIKATVDPRAETRGVRRVKGDQLYHGMTFADRCMGLPGLWQPQPPLTWSAWLMNLLGR